jgi:hypothetical protein
MIHDIGILLSDNTDMQRIQLLFERHNYLFDMMKFKFTSNANNLFYTL